MTGRQRDSEEESGRTPVTELFDRYVRAREEGPVSNCEPLLAEAGAARAELERRVRVYEDMLGVSEEISRAEARVPETLQRFRIQRLLGKGGLGRVFLADDPELKRSVALKVIEGVAGEERRWVLNEARSLAKLEHPGVVKVFEVGSAEGRDYVVMEYLSGPSLQAVIGELRRLQRGTEPAENSLPPSATRRLAERLRPFSARVKCLARIARALAYCNDRGVLHRDVTPKNVLFDEKDEPRLIDFGLAHVADADEEARVDVTQRLVLTPAFAAPEQIEQNRTGADPRSDQFSFGLVAYVLLTLVHPFERESRTTTLDAIVRGRPRALRRHERAIPADLERVVMHALEHDPDERYPDFDALANDLEAVLEHRAVSVREPALGRALGQWFRRNRRRVLGASAAAGLVLALLAGQRWMEALRERRAILGELAAVDLEGARTPGQLLAAGDELRALAARSRRFDAGGVRRTVLGGTTAAVSERSAAWWSRTNDELAHGEEASAEQGVRFQHRAWSRLVELGGDLCPECPDEQGWRTRGRTHLPAVSELAGRPHAFYELGFVQELPPGFSVPLEVDFVSELVPNVYRLLVFDTVLGHVAQELEFAVQGPWEELRELRLPLRDPEALAWTVEVEAGEVTVRMQTPQGAMPMGALHVPAFRVGPPVTREDLERFLDGNPQVDTPLLSQPDEERGFAEAAWIDHATAMAYAHSHGGRLPTLLELERARDAGAVDLEGCALLGLGEWVSDPHPGTGIDQASFVHYALYGAHVAGEATQPLLTAVLGTSSRDSLVFQPGMGEAGMVGVLFRVVFSADRQEAYGAFGYRPPEGIAIPPFPDEDG